MSWKHFLKTLVSVLMTTTALFTIFATTNAQDPQSVAFTLYDDSLRLEVPEGWVAEDQGIWIMVTNDETLLEVSGARLEEGDAIMLIIGATEYSNLGLPEGVSAQESLETVVERSQTNVYGDIYEATFGERPIFRTDYTSPNSSEGFYAAFDGDDGRTFIIITFSTAGEFSDFEQDLVGIAASVELSEPNEDANYRLITDASIGPEDAEVTIMEVGAYGCHACRAFHHNGVTDALIALTENPQYEGRVRFVFVNFPVISPFNDPISAEVAQCIIDQSEDDFWTFHDAIYDMSDAEYAQLRTAVDFVHFAEDQGIESTDVALCLDNRTHRGTVNYNLNRSSRLGVQGTPTFFVNGERVSPDLIEAAVQSALEG